MSASANDLLDFKFAGVGHAAALTGWLRCTAGAALCCPRVRCQAVSLPERLRRSLSSRRLHCATQVMELKGPAAASLGVSPPNVNAENLALYPARMVVADIMVRVVVWT
jgi:hypothetical protein